MTWIIAIVMFQTNGYGLSDEKSVLVLLLMTQSKLNGITMNYPNCTISDYKSTIDGSAL